MTSRRYLFILDIYGHGRIKWRKGGGRVGTHLEKNARKSAVRQETNRRSFPRGRPFRLVRRTRVSLMIARRECWFIRFSFPFPPPHNLCVSIFLLFFLFVCFFSAGAAFSPLPPLVFDFITDVRRRATRQRSSVIREAGVAGGCPCSARRHLSVLPPPPLQHDIIRILRLRLLWLHSPRRRTRHRAQGVQKMAVQIGFFQNRCCIAWSEKTW